VPAPIEEDDIAYDEGIHERATGCSGRRDLAAADPER
jgi:hypothetical protein